MKRRMIKVLLMGICVVVLVFASARLYGEYSEYKAGAKAYTELSEYIEPSESEETSQISTESDTEPIESINWPTVDFEALTEINGDFVAWIQIEGTQINYPVVQGEDNKYYLKHLFDGKWNSSGCIFLDYRSASDMSDPHTAIYGHHMKNGTMFSDLMKYKKQEFYDEHPTGYLLTPNENYVIEFFSGYVAKSDSDAWQLGFATEEEFGQWLEDARGKSCFESSTVPTAADKILTLSTCSYEFDNARFVLHGILRGENR